MHIRSHLQTDTYIDVTIYIPFVEMSTHRTYLLNCVKTMFQISRTLGSSMLTISGTSLPPMRSKWISVHGPHGPYSPISQKLSFIPNGRTLFSGRLGWVGGGGGGGEVGGCGVGCAVRAEGGDGVCVCVCVEWGGRCLLVSGV